MNHIPNLICYGRGDKVPDGYRIINTTSHSKEQWSKHLSPFHLGPITVNPTGECDLQANKFENAWQYLKVYADHYDADTNTIKQSWTDWSNEGFRNPAAVRFPRGKGAKPLFSLWKGEKMGYIEARTRIYAPLYAECVLKHAANEFAILKRLYDSGEKLALFDFDGYAHYNAGLSLTDVLYNEKKKMGHSFVLMGMLTENLFWEQDFDKNKIKSISVKRIR